MSNDEIHQPRPGRSCSAFAPECSLGVVVAIFVLAAPVVGLAEDGGAAERSYPPSASLDEVRMRVDAARDEHPRLLAGPDDLEALRTALAPDGDPLRRKLANAVIRQAESFLDAAPVERKLQGRRLLGQSRRCLERTITLSVAWHLTEDAKYVRRCEREMLAVSRFSDWNPSHFLDVAEMTAALAIGYDWLHGELDEGAREEIRQAIVEKGVRLPFETSHRGWVRATNNWGQVCHGGLVAGALAVFEDEPALAARTVHNAIQNVPRSMAAYQPKGGYPEGPGYWSYGTSYNVLLIALLESVLGTDFGLGRAPGFAETGAFLSLVTGPSGLFFNFADGGSRRSPQPALFWFASRFDRPDWLLGERDRVEERLDAAGEGESLGRFLPLALLWMPEEHATDVEIRMPLHWRSDGETPVTVHRTSWTAPDAVFVGVKGGSPSANHGQMDTGSFVLDADGVRWAFDLGAEGYHGIESRGMDLWNRRQDSDRWTIFRQMNHGHNTLVIDGELQRAAGEGVIVAFSDDPDAPFTVVDLSSVYEGQAKSVRRGVRILSTKAVLVRDELSGLEPGSRVRWGMITPGEAGPIGGDRVTLREGDATLALELRSSDADSAWEIVDTATPRRDWDSPNPGTRMVAFHAVAPSSGELAMTVTMTPGSSEASRGGELDSEPLASWER